MTQGFKKGGKFRPVKTRTLEGGTTIDAKTGEVVNPHDSLFGRGHFVVLKNGQDVFVPKELSSKQAKTAIDLVNGDVSPKGKFDATEVRLLGGASADLTERQRQQAKIILNGKEAMQFIKKSEKRFGTIPAFNVAKVVKPIG